MRMLAATLTLDMYCDRGPLTLQASVINRMHA